MNKCEEGFGDILGVTKTSLDKKKLVSQQCVGGAPTAMVLSNTLEIAHEIINNDSNTKETVQMMSSDTWQSEVSVVIILVKCWIFYRMKGYSMVAFNLIFFYFIIILPCSSSQTSINKCEIYISNSPFRIDDNCEFAVTCISEQHQTISDKVSVGIDCIFPHILYLSLNTSI